MKRKLFSFAVMAIGAINLAIVAQGQNQEIGGDAVTCYATYTSQGTVTITKCNGCTELDSAESFTDASTCRK